MANSSDNQSPEPLERRPEARTFKIEDLLADVRRGRVRIPSFQRRMKWEREDARKLLDSIYRGYPVGTLLFWETTAPIGEMRFGTVAISASERTDAWWVVDGQQRIASLTRVLLASDPDTDEFALYFDLEETKFIVASSPDKRSEDPGRWLPMTEVLDSERLFLWLLELKPANKDRRDRAILLGKRIREYDIPTYLLRTNNEEILREVFGRVNSSGKKLDASDIFDALHGSRSGTKPSTIPQIVSKLTELDFGSVEEKIVFRLLRVLQGADVSESGRPLRLADKDASATAYKETVKAAELAVEFLKRDGGIPHYELLPYKQPLVILGKFFHYYPALLPRSRDLLVRWLWRGILNGKHLGDNVSTRKALKCIQSDGEQESVQRMLKMVEERPAVNPDVDDKFNFRHSVGKLLALAMMDLCPRDLSTGEILNFGEFLDSAHPNRRQLLFPPVIALSSLNHGEYNAYIPSVANRLAHPTRVGLRRLLIKVTDMGVLASHGITEAAIIALRNGEVGRFFALRAEYLRPHFEDFFDRHARWDESDRPSLASLMVADEED